MLAPTTLYPSRAPVSLRRVGHGMAALATAFLLWLVNVWPGWQAAPFLTEDAGQIVSWLNASLWVGIAVHLLLVVDDRPRLQAAGDVVTTGFSLVVTWLILDRFPFDLPEGSVWPTVVRVLLVIALIGTIVGTIDGLARMVGAQQRRRQSTP